MQLEWIDLDKPKLFTKRRILFLVVIALCLLIFGALRLLRAGMTKDLVDTRAAERFAPEGGYAQVSCYFTEGANITAGRYREFLYRIETALTLAAIEPDEDASEGAQLFLTCYSKEAKLKLTHGSKTVDADAIGTAGDFFFPASGRARERYVLSAGRADEGPGAAEREPCLAAVRRY